MRKYLYFLLICIFFLNGCSNNLPIYQSKENFNTVDIDGTEYSLHKLSYDGKVYISEPEQYTNPNYYEGLKLGKQIGKTDDDMQIYKVENDDKRVVMKGFMFPETFYKLDNGIN